MIWYGLETYKAEFVHSNLHGNISKQKYKNYINISQENLPGAERILLLLLKLLWESQFQERQALNKWNRTSEANTSL